MNKEDDNAPIGTLTVSDRYILTSGGYERYFESGGRQYQHIIDPRTCAPSDSSLQSVTVVTPLKEGSGIAADALATALFIMGPDRAAEFWRENDRWFDMLLIDTEGNVYITDGIDGQFTLSVPDQHPRILLT